MAFPLSLPVLVPADSSLPVLVLSLVDSHSCVYSSYQNQYFYRPIQKKSNLRTLASRRKRHALSNLKLGWVKTGVERQKLTSSASRLGSQVKENIARLDDVGRNGARRSSENRDVDDLSNEDQVWVGDLRVGGDQALEGYLVVCCDGGEGVTGDDDVETWAT